MDPLAIYIVAVTLPLLWALRLIKLHGDWVSNAYGLYVSVLLERKLICTNTLANTIMSL